MIFYNFRWTDSLVCFGLVYSECVHGDQRSFEKETIGSKFWHSLFRFVWEIFWQLREGELWYVRLVYTTHELVKFCLILGLHLHTLFCGLHSIFVIISTTVIVIWQYQHGNWCSSLYWHKISCGGQSRCWLSLLLFGGWNLALLTGFWAIGMDISNSLKQMS